MASAIVKPAVPSPSASSLTFRANLARLVSPLRRVRPRVPFFELAIHRVPTLSLYRRLLRYAPDDNIRGRVQDLFRKHQHATGTEKTRRELLKGYKWLDAFETAHEGDEKQRAILRRYSRLIAAKLEKEHWKRLARAEVTWQERLRSRPILTGSIIKPTFYNPPLPRMKPQPPEISKIIRRRMRTRTRRYEHLDELREHMDDLRREAHFEENLIRLVGADNFQCVFSGELGSEWQRPLKQAQLMLYTLLNRDNERAQMPVSPALQEMVRAARREKVRNKTRERMRERRGEILRCTVARKRKGPPAHVLVHMSPEDRHVDKVVRAVGEVGYVGMVKRRMGMKLRDGGKALARENGLDLEGERLERLREMEKEYWIQGTRRTRRNDSVTSDSH
ncbi:hypothetical protein GGX14DRAFT_645874 [Mycena pura]|uniref:Complex 1 LYR protein domain-containing protein n=1 Tax=Mycena pura TaxID=153505 RepID=A0AAD6YBW3_9AGAR|nr:hypothetical protein GGX14DRAFT_645874 [Mycena pura]